MNAKKAKKLRKLASYNRPETPEYKGKAHGPREKINSIHVKVNDKHVSIPVSTKYQAITIFNESKAKYNVAKRVFYALKKTFNKE